MKKKNEAANITEAPVAMSQTNEPANPRIPEKKANVIAHQNSDPAERAIFRAEAAGKISKAVTSRSPTALMLKATTIAKRPA